MKRKHFLTQKQIKHIVKHYGGFYKYRYNPNVVNEYDKLYLCQKSNKYLWLCISNNQDNLVVVTLTNSTGVIIKRDYWDMLQDNYLYNKNNNKKGEI